MKVVVYQETNCQKERERERVKYKFINSSYESMQHVYPSKTNTYA